MMGWQWHQLTICNLHLSADRYQGNCTSASSLIFFLQTGSVVTVSKRFLSVGFGRFCRKNLGFRFGLGFHDKHVVNFFMTRVIWHDFHHR